MPIFLSCQEWDEAVTSSHQSIVDWDERYPRQDQQRQEDRYMRVSPEQVGKASVSQHHSTHKEVLAGRSSQLVPSTGRAAICPAPMDMKTSEIEGKRCTGELVYPATLLSGSTNVSPNKVGGV